MKKNILFVILVSLMMVIPSHASENEDYAREILKLHQEINALKDRMSRLEQNGTQESNVQSIIIPCLEDSYDTEDECRAIGIGQGETHRQALEEALQAAKDELITRMQVFHNKVLTQTQVQIVYSNIEFQCRRMEQTDAGLCKSYVAISVKKNVIK